MGKSYYKLKQGYLDKLNKAFNKELDACLEGFTRASEDFVNGEIEEIDSKLAEAYDLLGQARENFDEMENSDDVKFFNIQRLVKVYRLFQERKIETSLRKMLDGSNIKYLRLLKAKQIVNRKNKKSFDILRKSGKEMIEILSELRFCPAGNGVSMVANFQTFSIDIRGIERAFSNFFGNVEDLDLSEFANLETTIPLTPQSIEVQDFVYEIEDSDYKHQSNLPQPKLSDYEVCEDEQELVR